MRRRMKKILCCVALILCMASNTVPVFADTVQFDITVPGDIKSKKVKKADDEQKFYVTGTYFSKRGTLNCVSHKYDNKLVFSMTATISNDSTKDNAQYFIKAKPNAYYYMNTSASVNDIQVKGRYTP